MSQLRIGRDADGSPAMPGATRRVDTSVPWPPAPSPNDTYETVSVAGGGKVRGRVLRLWGQRVIVDQAGAVHCPYCYEFVPLDELVDPGNAHPVGLRPVGEGVALPLGRDPGRSPW